MPGASANTHGLACEWKKHTSVVTTGSDADTGIPCAMVLAVYSVLSPVSGVACHRREAGYFRPLDATVAAPGPHGFAVRC